jgi:hypothetical protein
MDGWADAVPGTRTAAARSAATRIRLIDFIFGSL